MLLLTLVQSRFELGGATKMLTALTDQAADGPARFVAAVSGRTQKKDSFAAPKTLPFNDFLQFTQCA